RRHPSPATIRRCAGRAGRRSRARGGRAGNLTGDRSIRPDRRLINNAGVIQVGPVEHMTVSDYDDAMNTHFWGPLFFVLAVLPEMRRQGSGRIVNISSVGGRMSVPHLVPYSASKF